MGVFAVIGVIYLIYKLISEACEPTLPAEYHRNWRLEAHDCDEVRMGRMTQKQFEKNMKNGKYR